MAVAQVVDLLKPVVEGYWLLDDWVTPEEDARALELAKELRAIHDAAVQRYTSGRVG